ncbi:MAG: VanZ family protein, partial [Phycisphaeraceae bacterium]
LAFLFLSAHLLKGTVLRPAGRALVGLVVGAGIDEVTQYFVPGRGVHWSDWFASSLGIAGGVASWAGLRWLILSHDNSFISHTRVVSAMTVLSRVFGLVRDWALARVFGFGVVMDAFIIAFMVPNLFRRLFGEGALAAAFIPHYSRLREREARAATRFALLVVDVLTTGLVGFAMLGALAMGALAFYGDLDPRGTLTAGLTAVTLWYMPLVCITAILGAVLQVHGRFAVPAATPVILNLFVIAAALGGGMLLGNDFTSHHTVFLVAVSIVLAGIVQVVWQVVALRKAGVHLRESRQHDNGQRWGGPLVKEAGGGLLRQWVPTVMGLAIFQLNALADALIALFFSGPAGA